MSIRKILYPLDFSGTATSNRIEGELKTIGVDRYRAFTLNFAPFFTNTLTIKERGKTKLLVRGTDYECLYFYPELTKLAAGKEVCGVVVITNAAIGIDLEVGYNTVGGHYAHSADVIQMAITALELDNRNVYWEDVIDTPTLFQPAPHMHDIGDVYGMEFQIDALVALREAILVGDNTVHQQIYDRIDNVVLSLTTMLNAHRADIANPHKTTAHQVNAYTREEIDTEIAAIMSDLADLEPRFQAIATTFTQIQQQYTSMTSSLAALSTRVGTVENEQSKFYLLLATINQTLAAHQASIDAIHVEITALKAKDVNLQTQIDGLKTRATNIESKNVEQDVRLNDIESLNTAQNNRLDLIETKNTAQDIAITNVTNTANAAAGAFPMYVPWSRTGNGAFEWEELLSKCSYIDNIGIMQIGKSLVFHHSSITGPAYGRQALSLLVDPSPTPGLSTLYNTGYFNCQDIYVRSDIRDKHEITRIEPDIADTILRKLGSGIRYKLHEETEFTAGLSAQEVVEVFPEAVGTCSNSDGEQRFTMRQNAIIGLLVSGYNKQAAIIESLLAKVDELTKG